MRCIFHLPLQMVGGVILFATAAAYAEPKLVSLAPLSQVQVPIVYSAPAEVVTLNQTQIGAEIRAKVQSITADVGAVVEAGAVLATLDCRDYELARARAAANLKSAEALLALARQQLQRVRDLATSNNVSQDVLDQRRAEMDSAVAEVDARRIDVADAALDVERCTIVSPYRAAVVERSASVGMLADAGTPMVVVQDLTRTEISAQIIPSEVASLSASQDMALEYLGQTFPLHLLRISPIVDRTTRTREVRAAFSAAAAPVGATGRLHWTARQPGLPASLLVRRGDALGVFVAEAGRARFIAMPQAREGLPVVTDLAPETLLVIDGRHSIDDGDEIAATD